MSERLPGAGASPSRNQPVALIGPPGAGKTSLGREVARLLSRPFVDTDALVEKRAGRSIVKIVAEQGEVLFRAIERGVCLELTKDSSAPIVAMGGGAWMDPEVRGQWTHAGLCIQVDATPQVCAERLKNQDTRPFLNGLPPPLLLEQLVSLARSRTPIYRSAHLSIRSDGSPQQLARRLARRIQAWEGATHSGRTLNAEQGGRPYAIHIEPGCHRNVPAWLEALAPSGTVVIVHQPSAAVADAAGRIASDLRSSDVPVSMVTMPDREQAKSLGEVERLCDRFAELGLRRSGLVLGVGGGALSDAAGFAASIYQRGVPFIAIPTTLLAAVDASIGGKTGVNTSYGKNYLGTITAPRCVIIDPSLFDSLPRREFNAGMAEVIKHGLLGDPGLLDCLDHENIKDEDWLRRALVVKQRIVEEDPNENGPRAVLNLGHTFAHALEKQADFDLLHGEAVAVGLVAALWLSRDELGLPDEVIDKTRRLLVRYQLPIEIEGDVEALTAAMMHDKKVEGDSLRLILLQQIGEPVIRSPGMAAVRRAWNSVLRA